MFRKPGSQYYWYTFYARGRRHRGSTKETSWKRAHDIAALKYSDAAGGKKPGSDKLPTLRAAGKRLQEWLQTARIKPASRRYYENGWRLLTEHEALLDMPLDEITTDDIDALTFAGSGSNANNALRTLRRIFQKAKKDWKYSYDPPRVNLHEERERTMLLDEEAEVELLKVAEQPLADIVILMRELGTRNQIELYPLRIENISWRRQTIRIPDSKTKAGHRLVPLSPRAEAILRARCGDRKEAWVFPSRRKGKHITGGLVNKQWVKARKKAGLPADLVLYCARHDFGTDMVERTGNLKAVMEVMGHADTKTAMKYQHPGLNVVASAMRERSQSWAQSGHSA
jgi:integrase